MQVKVIAIDDQDRVKLSRKILLRGDPNRAPGEGGPPPRENYPPREGGRGRRD